MEHTFETPGPVRLRVNVGAGRVEVETGVDGRTEIELTARNRSARELLDEMTVRCEQRGGTYDILVVEPKRWGFVSNLLNNAEIDVRVRCPQETAVEFQTGSADAVVRGQVVSGHAKTGSGDLSFGEVVGELIANSASGDVSAGDVGGDCTVKTASGDVRLHRVGGDLIANLVSGDLHVLETQGDVTVSTVSGDQWIGSVAGGEIRLQAVSGDVRVGVMPGLRLWIDATSVSGDMSSELDAADGPPGDDGPVVQLRAKTVSGDVRIARAG
jgi:DUF4097 and DUF4098 domain-containing protein YvlB